MINLLTPLWQIACDCNDTDGQGWSASMCASKCGACRKTIKDADLERADAHLRAAVAKSGRGDGNVVRGAIELLAEMSGSAMDVEARMCVNISDASRKALKALLPDPIGKVAPLPPMLVLAWWKTVCNPVPPPPAIDFAAIAEEHPTSEGRYRALADEMIEASPRLGAPQFRTFVQYPDGYLVSDPSDGEIKRAFAEGAVLQVEEGECNRDVRGAPPAPCQRKRKRTLSARAVHCMAPRDRERC